MLVRYKNKKLSLRYIAKNKAETKDIRKVNTILILNFDKKSDIAVSIGIMKSIILSEPSCVNF